MKRWMMETTLAIMFSAGLGGCTPSLEEQLRTFVLDFPLQVLAAWLF